MKKLLLTILLNVLLLLPVVGLGGGVAMCNAVAESGVVAAADIPLQEVRKDFPEYEEFYDTWDQFVLAVGVLDLAANAPQIVRSIAKISAIPRSFHELRAVANNLPTNAPESILRAWDEVLGVSTMGTDLVSFVNKTLTQKLDDITDIWNTKYPVQEMLEGRSFFEDIMGHYRYTKGSGWSHTGDISEFFKGVDFYKGTTQGTSIFAETAVSMKTTITTNVDIWLASAPIKKNIEFLEQGWKNANGLESNGMKMFFNNAEIHIYMPKANITETLKTTWMNKLNTVNPKIKFEIKALEDFVQ